MFRTAKLLIAASAIATLTTGARAADFAPVVVPPVPSVVPVPVETGFDWQGFYVGAAHSAVVSEGAFSWYIPSAQVGYNLTFGRLLLGVQAKAGAYLLSGTGLTLQFDARAGVALDRVAIYGLFGALAYGPAPLGWYAVGGVGVEVALGDRLSVFAELRLEEVFTPPFYLHAVAGVNWHLGN